MNDWDLNPEKYLVDDQGNFVLKLDGTPKKKAGRAKGSKGRGYNYHSTTKAKIESKGIDYIMCDAFEQLSYDKELVDTTNYYNHQTTHEFLVKVVEMYLKLDQHFQKVEQNTQTQRDTN